MRASQPAGLMMPRLTAVLALWLCACPTPKTRVDAASDPQVRAPPPQLAPGAPLVQYTLRFSARSSHYVDVEAVMPTRGRDEITLTMAVWTPGSYLVREYSRHVEDLVVVGQDRQPLSLEKVRKNRWRVTTGGESEVMVRYRVYSRVMTVRGNWVDADFAMLNGAPTFVTLVDRTDGRGKQLVHDVYLDLPDEWKISVTGLWAHPNGQPHHYRAADYDTLVDSPIIAGNPAVHELTVAGAAYFLVNVGEDGIWDGPASAKDVATLVQTHVNFWRVTPYQRYLFLNVISGRGGGLEHKNSTLIMTDRFVYRLRETRENWLRLVSHEFFHTWNVKRLRPVELGPFDYESENYTKNLWIAEGITSYYDILLLRRSGLIEEKAFLHNLSKKIKALQITPGRNVHALEMTSFDAWIKYYRKDENTANTTVSYYNKGAVVGFLLDAKIRQATSDRKSLDDVMRLLYQRHSGPKGYTSDDFRRAVADVAGRDFGDWLVSALETGEELAYTDALFWFGLRFGKPTDEDTPDAKPGWLGLSASEGGDNLILERVLRGTPAFAAGLNVGDEVVAVDGFRVRAADWDERRKRYAPGDKAELLLSRRGKLRHLDAVFAEQPADNWQLEVDPRAGFAKARRERWQKRGD